MAAVAQPGDAPLRIQTSSQPSSSAHPDSPTSSPSPNSASRLILVQEDDEFRDSPSSVPQFEEDSDEDDDDDDGRSSHDDHFISQDHRPLSPLRTLLYLIAPALRLGAFLLPFLSSTRLAITLPCLLVSVLLTALVRHIWLLLARYVKRATVEEVCSEALAKMSNSPGWRGFIKVLIRVGGTALAFLISLVYLRVAIISLLPLLPESPHMRPILAAIILFLLIPLVAPPSHISSNLLFATSLTSCILYVAWFSVLLHSKVVDSLTYDETMRFVGISGLWDSLTCSLFAYGSFSPLQLYVSLSAHRTPTLGVATRMKRRTSFTVLSLVASIVSLAFTLPLIFVHPPTEPLATSTPVDDTLPKVLRALRALILFLSIPEVFTNLPFLPRIPASFPLPALLRRPHPQFFPRGLLLILISFATLIPTSLSYILSSVLLILSIIASYLFPALLHIIHHNLLRPTAIVVPASRSRAHLMAGDGEDDSDALLFAKELALQRRRFGRRVMWDIAAWALLAGAILWIVGRIVHWWWL
ncbi:hypothetical protein SISSUDRAFT_1130220 [Sistotremastrum suecicum HHB10207 ss-3]|uniref:Amino acid transporter transmembrane domain-containing protein n=1 Tax=Sistotremastrum suecicum HHB10207 ss-3 TaxID=1314776 RepID=A0A166BR45_9AGAM|nr:hypothetical protein SISSUDRAFT_1130220 [Sistotremastrum suecicum HHB10207 ss-3]